MMLKALLLLAATTTSVVTKPLDVSHKSVTLRALLTLVQHQTSTLQTMQSQLTSLQTSNSEQDSAIRKLKNINSEQDSAIKKLKNINSEKDSAIKKLKNINSEQENAIKKLKNKVTDLREDLLQEVRAKSRQVAFTAHMSKLRVNVGDNGPFLFDKVVTNIGNGYNPHSGIFTAPYDGVYVFSFIMVNTHDGATIHAQIEKNGMFLGAGTSTGIGTSNKWDDGSALATTHLKKGDHVYVKRRAGGTMVNGDVFTNFSGFLLSIDAGTSGR